MTPQHALAGVYAAAVTPLYEQLDPTLDLESVPLLMQFLASRGCHGMVLFGTTGEGPSFSPTERETLMRAARNHESLLFNWLEVFQRAHTALLGSGGD